MRNPTPVLALRRKPLPAFAQVARVRERSWALCALSQFLHRDAERLLEESMHLHARSLPNRLRVIRGSSCQTETVWTAAAG